jgi:hypothetical protein
LIKRLLPFAFTLLGCGQTTQSENTRTDSSSIPTNLGNDYELASTDRELDSERLLADTVDLARFFAFSAAGTNINEKEYGAGDCDGKFKQIGFRKGYVDNR